MPSRKRFWLRSVNNAALAQSLPQARLRQRLRVQARIRSQYG